MLPVFIRYSNDFLGDKRIPKKAVVYGKSDHKIDLRDIDIDAIRVISRLQDEGFEAFLVGGAVRDLFLGLKPKDFDIATDARPAQIRRLFRNSRIIGKRFKLTHVFFGEKIFEVSTFRAIEGDSTVGNVFGRIEQDVMRRDFTLNALYFDPLKSHIIDFVGGVEDLKKRVIRPVIPLKTIFLDDPVRMVRAVKYKATTGFGFSAFLSGKIRKSAELLSQISPSRMTEEMLKIVKSPRCKDIASEMLNFGIYGFLQKSASEMCRNAAFKTKYLESLGEAQRHNEEGEKSLSSSMTFFVRDFAKISCESAKAEGLSGKDFFSKVFSECRQFVLPMNPPKQMLGIAVQSALKDLGFVRKGRKRRAQAAQGKAQNDG